MLRRECSGRIDHLGGSPTLASQNRPDIIFSKRSVLLRLLFPLGSTLVLTLKEALLKSCPFPEILCVICSKPVDLSADLPADENGKAVHAKCYVKRIRTTHCGPSIVAMAD
jgi:hypothetical protein